MIKCDYLIIGMGVAGIAMKNKLKGNTILIDATPFSYKIGESHIPNFIHADLNILNLTPKIKDLKSFSIKKGTIFSDSKKYIYSDMVFTELKDLYAFHSNRSELEKFLVKELGIKYKAECVKEINLEKNQVITNLNAYQFTKYVIDCSGPAKLIANHLGKTKINPEWGIAHATRGYFDIKKINANEKNVSEYTLLNHINDGTWMWQIPLYKSSILSVGIISLKKTLIKGDYEKLVLKYKHPFYSEISLKRGTGELERIRTRQGFSESSTISSGKNFILVGDAYSFTDPVFSIGTGTAVSEAVYVANSLNNGVFNPKEYDEKCKKVNASFLTSFKFWYNDDWKKKYNLSLIQKNTLQGNTLIENFHHFDSTLSSYIGLVTGMEGLYEGNHQNIKHFKNIIVYFAEENYNFNNSILLLGYFGLNSSKYIEIKEEEVINFFISIKGKLLDTKTVIKLSMKYNISIQQKIIYYFKSLIIKKIIPTYKKP